MYDVIAGVSTVYDLQNSLVATVLNRAGALPDEAGVPEKAEAASPRSPRRVRPVASYVFMLTKLNALF